ncbi:2-dehydropantoate 2-reductase [Microdochium nivale]|nr:2-dehydropantoate 2-reductase [Microdochium nivale]
MPQHSNMAETFELMRVCTVGGNAVSAFLSWRLQATNACDVTLVWKSGFEAVSQYGISFRSASFGNERFKPRHVVQTPESASQFREGAFDYVILCIKALPDIYDLASVIDSVVTPQHTCILINTTTSLGVEAAIEERFPTNVVLSLVSNAELTQLGSSEFEHTGSTEMWVGPANKNSNIPVSIQEDMAEALAMTLSTARVDCKVSKNIRQQQFERVIGPIAFHPASVLFDTASHSALLEKTGVRQLVSDVIDELITLANAQGCTLSPTFKEDTIKEQTQQTDNTSIMWQDYMARRPMEVETYLGSPIKLAQSSGVKIPRVETLYAIFHNLNIVNQARPKETPAGYGPPAPSSPTTQAPMPRMPSGPPRPIMNGAPNNMPNGQGMGRAQPRPRNSSNYSGPPPGMRRPPQMNGAPPPNGFRPPMNGGPNGGPNGFSSSRQASRRGSLDEHDLEEFSHLVMYSEEGTEAVENGNVSIRERELQIRQRELALKEQEMRMRRGPPPPPGGPRRRGPPPMRNNMIDDDDEEDDYFDPNSSVTPMIDPENFDMMSVTSRKNRGKVRPNQQGGGRPHFDGMEGAAVPPARGGRGGWRPGFSRNRASQVMDSSMPNLHDNILDDPLMSCSSNRYGNVDRGQMQAGSRANSLTTSHLNDFAAGGGMNGMNGGYPRRASQAPGNPYSPSIRGGNGRPSPPNGFGGPGGHGRPSPPDGMRQSSSRFPPGPGASAAPQQLEQRVGRGEW